MEYTKSYCKYKGARDKAWGILIENNIVKFPFDLYPIIHKYGIKTIKYTESLKANGIVSLETNIDAVAINLNERNYIVYRADKSMTRLKFTLAHELGHVLLNHIEPNAAGNYSDYQESEANIFASRLLMPAIVCHIEKLNQPQDIADFFGVSLESATIRANRIAELEKRKSWGYSPLEREYTELYYLRK